MYGKYISYTSYLLGRIDYQQGILRKTYNLVKLFLEATDILYIEHETNFKQYIHGGKQMRIGNEVSQSSGYTGGQKTSANSDPVIAGLQKQIANVEKQIKDLANDKEMDPKEKTARRKELTGQIADLNKQINNRKNEIRQEEQQKREEEIKKQSEKAVPKKEQEEQQNSTAKLTKMLVAAESASSEGDTLQKVRTDMQGELEVLKRTMASNEALKVNSDALEGRINQLEERLVETTDGMLSKFKEASEAIDPNEVNKDTQQTSKTKKEEEEDKQQNLSIIEKEEKEKQDPNLQDPLYVDVRL